MLLGTIDRGNRRQVAYRGQPLYFYEHDPRGEVLCNDIVEAQTGREVPIPPALARLLSLPRQEKELDASLEALRAELQRS